MNVSIVIPAYNAAETISDTLESLLAQSHPDWEALVVDDGSVDATSQVVSAFSARDARIRLLGRPNGGESAARNTGLSEARHGWVLFLDADDWIAAEHLERMTRALQTDSSLDAVHCRYARVAADGTAVVERYRPPNGDLFPVLARRAAFPVHACLVRRALVDDMGGFDPTLLTSPDWDLWQRIARTGARFGAVDEVLAFYRMSPGSASLNACQLFQDGLRILRQGHAADPRVARPHPDHAAGAPPEGVLTQQFYLLSWCAGLLLGANRDPRPLLTFVGDDRFSDLSADAVAECIFEAAPLPTCRTAAAWTDLWPAIQDRIADFLLALESQTLAPDLSARTRASLERRILESSPLWSVFSAHAEELRASSVQAHQQLRLETEEVHRQLVAARAEIARLRDEVGAAADRQRRLERDLQEQSARLETTVAQQDRRHQEALAALRSSPEWIIGDTAWNVARGSRIGRPAARYVRLLRDRRNRTRLAVGNLARGAVRARPRAVVAACWSFPIHSQTFVYQEVLSLGAAGLDSLVFCCQTNPKSELPPAFEELWHRRVVLNSERTVNQRDLDHFRRTRRDRVDSLLARIGAATGLEHEALLGESIVMMGFTFARHVELAGASYLHTYFFYDQSFMALMAAYLLGIPRGVTAYADHMLQDYAFKLVPLHLELADIVVATSRRIKDELDAIGQGRFTEKILVKPNGIATSRFPHVAPGERLTRERPELIAVNRIEPKKGLIHLIEAMAILKARGRPLTLHLVGGADPHTPSSATYYRELTARIAELGLDEHVIRHGMKPQPEFIPLLARSSIFVAPYVEVASGDKDGIPTAVLEAMATGLPIVATDAGSLHEAVTPGVEALCVPQRDAERLADAIARLLDEPATYAAMSAAARRRATSQFDVRVTERPLHEAIRRCLASRG